MKLFALSALFILFASRSFATVYFIGSSSATTVTNSMYNRGMIGRSPADGSIQTCNPPSFRWISTESPNIINSNFIRIYRLVISTNANLTTPIVDLTIPFNFYGTVAPFTNADGSTYTSTIYWSVNYFDSSTNSILWNTTNTFTLASGSVLWDRSMLASTNYLLSASTNHPHLWLKHTNLTAISNWLSTGWLSSSWATISNRAFQTITNSWWTDTNTWYSLNTRAERVAEVALTYRITSNSTLISADPMWAANLCATHFMISNYDRADPAGIAQAASKYIPFSYDWLYPELSSVQRSNMQYLAEVQCKYYLYSLWWYNDSTADPGTRTYPGPYGLNQNSISRIGDSHAKGSTYYGLSACLGAIGESDWLRGIYWPYVCNYMVAQYDPYVDDGGGFSQGRGYLSANAPHMARSIMPAIQMFDYAQLNLHPTWSNHCYWLMSFEPLRYKNEANHEPWGDLGQQLPDDTKTKEFRNWALMTQNKELYQYATNVLKTVSVDESTFTLLAPYYYPPPGIEDGTNVFYDPTQGWVISMTKPLNSWDAFTNGSGFITQGRPRGSEYNHSYATDGDIEYWYYGSMVTDAGVGNYRKHSQNHNTLMVDGIGMCLPQYPTLGFWTNYFAWISAYTNCADFTFATVDLTHAFYRTNFSIGGFGVLDEYSDYYELHPVPHLSSVTRSILWPGKKYLIIFDKMQSTTNATFSWKWNVLEPTATVNTSACSFTYTCTNKYFTTYATNITVHVKHIVDPTTMILTNLAGTNLSRFNPITLEDYNILDTDTASRWNHNIWVSTAAKQTNWHFMSVVYPQHWTNTEAPTITRIDDYTVAVTNTADGVADVVTFDTNYAGAYTYMIDTGPTNQLAPTQVATPSFIPAGGTYGSAQVVTISCATAGSTIYWSTNSVNVGTAYVSPVSITNTSTLRAYATASGMTSSETNTELYTISISTPQARSITINHLTVTNSVIFTP